jgi:hypothetical protein
MVVLVDHLVVSSASVPSLTNLLKRSNTASVAHPAIWKFTYVLSFLTPSVSPLAISQPTRF